MAQLSNASYQQCLEKHKKEEDTQMLSKIIFSEEYIVEGNAVVACGVG